MRAFVRLCLYISLWYSSYLSFFFSHFLPLTLSLSIASLFITSSSVAYMRKSIEIQFFSLFVGFNRNACSTVQNPYSLMPTQFSSDLFWSTNQNAIFAHTICARWTFTTAFAYFFWLAVCVCVCVKCFFFLLFLSLAPLISLRRTSCFSHFLASISCYSWFLCEIMWNYVKLYDKVLFDYYSFVFDWRCSNRNHSHSISVKEIEKGRVSHFLPLATPIVCAFVCEKKNI